MIQTYTLADVVVKQTTKQPSKPYISATLIEQNGVRHERVFIWSNFPDFFRLGDGTVLHGYLKDDGKGKSLASTMPAGYSKPAPSPAQPQHTTAAQPNNFREAQDRKDMGIRLSGAMNHATTVVTSMYADAFSSYPPADRAQKIKEAIIEWRDFFLDSWDVKEKLADNEPAF